MIEAFFGLAKNIVDVDLHGFAHQWSKYFGHQPLIGCSDILQAKRHYIVAVQSVRCNEGLFLYIRRVHGNLVVPRERVQR